MSAFGKILNKSLSNTVVHNDGQCHLDQTHYFNHFSKTRIKLYIFLLKKKYYSRQKLKVECILVGRIFRFFSRLEYQLLFPRIEKRVWEGMVFE